VKATVIAFVFSVVSLAAAGSARADGFITPFIGYNFGGDSGNCPSLTNCNERHANYGVSIGAMGPIFGIEEDISYANNFFGESPNASNSVFSAMTNLMVGVGVGPVQPYVLGGLGLIRPHVGIRGDIRHFHTIQDVNVLVFTGQRLDFFRASVGLALKF